MADSFLQANTDGTGKKVRTYDRTVGANTVHEEVLLLGESQLPYYSVSSAASIATAADHVLQIMAGSALHVRIKRIRIEQQANATTATSEIFQIFRLSTAGTGGTALTPRPYDTGDAAAGATAMAIPTAKGTEGVELMRTSLAMRSAVGTNGLAEDFFEWTQLPSGKAIIIPAGTSNGICIKSVTAIAAATVAYVVEFAESSWL